MLQTYKPASNRSFSFRSLNTADHWSCKACGQPHLYFEPVSKPRFCINCQGRDLRAERHPLLRLLVALGANPQKPIASSSSPLER